MPTPALLLGYAGLIPFITLSAGLWVLPVNWHDAVNQALLAYGAIILSFMGAVHWGLAIAGGKTDSWQLGLSVVPALVAWLASFAPLVINYSALIMAFAILCIFDSYSSRLGKVPGWYPALRVPLTSVVVCALLVAEVRLLF